MYAHLNTTTNFTFLTGASHPQEYVARARELGYEAIAITDECSLAGVVKAFSAAEAVGMKLLVGARFVFANGLVLTAIAPHRQAYAELSGFITLARRRASKGKYDARIEDLRFRLQHCLIIWHAGDPVARMHASSLRNAFKGRLWIGLNLQKTGNEARLADWRAFAKEQNLPLLAFGEALMHVQSRKPLLDTLWAIRQNTSVDKLGTHACGNAEAYLKPLEQLQQQYPEALLQATVDFSRLCTFSMAQLRYQYPRELVPKHFTPIRYLRHLVDKGKRERYPNGVSEKVEHLLQKELQLIEQLHYEYYFLTVYDIVRFARARDILCQGRGSAANSVVCYCLSITEIAPGQINVLFERFISKERDEPPDIDVDFEHHRREEVIQYIYQKYGRERAALAASVITYKTRSAFRDVGKALGLEPTLIEHFTKSLAWWDSRRDLRARIEAAGFSINQARLSMFFKLVQQILGFPRHLSQHVGGFVITQDKISDLVPMENASMPERTVIQWDKEDLETMRLLKVDVLALGMLTALRKALSYVRSYNPAIKGLESIPREDPSTYEMLCQAQSVGVFQVESRAQMSMLPRLRPRCFYDLVIQISIVRPGPIQGDMVHPYLRRRNGEEAPQYQSKAIREVLSPTLGVPIFQEQAIRLAMVAAGFSGGEADQLRRAMASWGKNGNLLSFETRFIQGMLTNGYSQEYALRLFEQIKGFGGYGFPESHSASFALLCYASSWLKCHHPAAFYCALLNSQPMGFYSPSQLVQDAVRHKVTVLPVDINASEFETRVVDLQQSVPEAAGSDSINGNKKPRLAIRLGFIQVKSLNAERAQNIETIRGLQPFQSLKDLVERTQLTASDLKHLAAADALASISGHRHNAHWQAAAVEETRPLALFGCEQTLTTASPTLAKEVVDDYASLGLTLRSHPLALLRKRPFFRRCKTSAELVSLNHGRFVRVAGIVTGRQRPSTAKGVVFITLEDETGNINVVVWQSVQQQFRQALLASRLLVVKGVVEHSDPQKGALDAEAKNTPVVHVIAGELLDYSAVLGDEFLLKSRDFH